MLFISSSSYISVCISSSSVSSTYSVSSFLHLPFYLQLLYLLIPSLSPKVSISTVETLAAWSTNSSTLFAFASIGVASCLALAAFKNVRYSVLCSLFIFCSFPHNLQVAVFSRPSIAIKSCNEVIHVLYIYTCTYP